MTLSIAGQSAITFGSNSPHSRNLLKDACEAQGWKKMVFRAPSKHGALERALNDIAKSLGDVSLPLSIRALSQDLAFEAVRTERGAQRNKPVFLFSAQVNKDTDAVTILDLDGSVSHGELSLLVQAAYDNQLNNLSASQVRTVIASVVRKLKGVALGAANLYYLPHDAVSAWQQWRDKAQLFRYHTVPFEVAADPATVEHIISQLNAEVSVDAQQIINAVATGSLEPRTAKALAKKAQSIVDKIKSYESALGQQLDWMREPLEQAEAALSVSTLMAVST
jgi:hypothetical protein